MCSHTNWSVIEDEVAEERWEGDDLTCDIYTWAVCQECGVDFACQPQ